MAAPTEEPCQRHPAHKPLAWAFRCIATALLALSLNWGYETRVKVDRELPPLAQAVADHEARITTLEAR